MQKHPYDNKCPIWRITIVPLVSNKAYDHRASQIHSSSPFKKCTCEAGTLHTPHTPNNFRHISPRRNQFQRKRTKKPSPFIFSNRTNIWIHLYSNMNSVSHRAKIRHSRGVISHFWGTHQARVGPADAFNWLFTRINHVWFIGGEWSLL